jgi:transposase InsO family protein
VLLERAYRVFGDERYARLAQISVAHLYNLRNSAGYHAHRSVWTRTYPTQNLIGVRRAAPRPDGRPGFIRIDSVHQGDEDGLKGVYHINAVDCVTQWELVATRAQISEAFLLPVIQALLDGFPFVILGFHADNGSEYVNHKVADMLEKLRIEFTRSRPRQSNDNALAETKNGAVVRKAFGYTHIPQRFALQVNAFNVEYLNPYVNFHRPSAFSVEVISTKGKTLKRYPQNLIMTPFDKLQSLSNAATFLKPGITLNTLRTAALELTDNQAAERLNNARNKLFQAINRRSKAAA